MKPTPRTARRAGVFLMAALLSACGDGQEAVPAAGQLPEGHPPLESSPYAHEQPVQAASGPAAVVLELEEVSDYTYARVRSQGEEIWVAGPKGGIAEGDTISLGDAMGMTDFTSSELGRTFESILFMSAWRPVAAMAAGNEGEILELISASSYAYIRARTEDGEVWLAGPRVPLEVGQTIAWSDGMAMENFASRTLERTFDVIYFVDQVRVVE